MAMKMWTRLMLQRMKPRTVHNLQVDKCIWTLAPRPISQGPLGDKSSWSLVPRPISQAPRGDKSIWTIKSREYKFRAPRHSSNRLLSGTNAEITQEMDEKLKFYGAMKPTSLSISELLKHGKRKCPNESFQFLRMCLPIRMANMILELQKLPLALTKQPEFQDVLNSYLLSFKKVLEFEMAEINEETVDKFMHYLISQRKRHANTVPTMAAAMKGMIMESGTSKNEIDAEKFQYFLDRLYLNRISIHLLISNFRELHDKQIDPDSSLVGIIDTDCDLVHQANLAYEEASDICDREFFNHPKLVVEGYEVDDVTRKVTQLEKITMAYIPSHLHHIFFEVFKNAMRATCEKNETSGGQEELGEIRVIIFKSKNDITIKISDVGGGISRYIVDRAFDYQYTTAKHVAKFEYTGSSNAGLQSHEHPMYGLGYGLPMARLYARYFQGDLSIASVNGYGTDVYIYLKALSEDASEHLPNYSPAVVDKHLTGSSMQGADWIDERDALSSRWPKES